MSEWARPEFTSVGELRGPLLIVHGVSGVGWDEFATIRLNGAAGGPASRPAGAARPGA